MNKKQPIFWFYKPRIVSYRGWVLAIQLPWILLVNVVSIIWGVIHLIALVLLYVFVTLPAYAIRRMRGKRYAASVDKARDQLLRYF